MAKNLKIGHCNLNLTLIKSDSFVGRELYSPYVIQIKSE